MCVDRVLPSEAVGAIVVVGKSQSPNDPCVEEDEPKHENTYTTSQNIEKIWLRLVRVSVCVCVCVLCVCVTFFFLFFLYEG